MKQQRIFFTFLFTPTWIFMNSTEFTNLLNGLLSPDTSIRTTAELHLNNFKESNFERFLMLCLEIMDSNSNIQHVSLGILLLKNTFICKNNELRHKMEEMYKRIDGDTRNNIRNKLLGHIVSTNIPKVDSIAQIVGALIRIERINSNSENKLNNQTNNQPSYDIFPYLYSNLTNPTYAIGILKVTMYAVIELLDNGYEFSSEDTKHIYNITTTYIYNTKVEHMESISHMMDILDSAYSAVYNSIEVYEEYVNSNFIDMMHRGVAEIIKYNESNNTNSNIIDNCLQTDVFIVDQSLLNISNNNISNILNIYGFMSNIITKYSSNYCDRSYCEIVELLYRSGVDTVSENINENELIGNMIRIVERIEEEEYYGWEIFHRVLGNMNRRAATTCSRRIEEYVNDKLNNISDVKNTLLVAKVLGCTVNEHMNSNLLTQSTKEILRGITNNNDMNVNLLLFSLSKICNYSSNKVTMFMDQIIVTVGNIISNTDNSNSSNAYMVICNIFKYYTNNYSSNSNSVLDKYVDRIIYVLLTNIGNISSNSSNSNTNNALYYTLYECIKYPMDIKILQNIKIFLYKEISKTLESNSDSEIVECHLSNIVVLLSGVLAHSVMDKEEMEIYCNAMGTLMGFNKSVVQGDVFLSISTLLNSGKLDMAQEETYVFIMNYVVTNIYKQIQENADAYTVERACETYYDIVSVLVLNPNIGNKDTNSINLDECMSIFSMILMNNGINYISIKTTVLDIFSMLVIYKQNEFSKYVDMCVDLYLLVVEYGMGEIDQNDSDVATVSELMGKSIELVSSIVLSIRDDAVKKNISMIVGNINRVTQMDNVSESNYVINKKTMQLISDIWSTYKISTLKSEWVRRYIEQTMLSVRNSKKIKIEEKDEILREGNEIIKEIFK